MRALTVLCTFVVLTLLTGNRFLLASEATAQAGTKTVLRAKTGFAAVYDEWTGFGFNARSYASVAGTILESSASIGFSADGHHIDIPHAKFSSDVDRVRFDSPTRAPTADITFAPIGNVSVSSVGSVYAADAYAEWSLKSNSTGLQFDTVNINETRTISVPSAGYGIQHLTWAGIIVYSNSSGANATVDVDAKLEMWSPEPGVSVKLQSQLTPQDVLRDSIGVSVADGVIRAEFTPRYGLTLAEAARIVGVKEFNWINTFTHHYGDPVSHREWVISGVDTLLAKVDLEVDQTSGELRSASGLFTVDEIVSAAVSLDPVIDGTRNMYVGTYQTADGDWRYVTAPQWGSDTHPYYLNLQSTAPPSEIPSIMTVDEYRTDRSLFFEDAPTVPAISLREGDYTQFATQLVGVTWTGETVTWAGLGTEFWWKSDRTYSETGDVFDIMYLSSRSRDVPPIESGGIFDVVVAVPEPNTASLTLVGAAVGIVLIISRARPHASAS